MNYIFLKLRQLNKESEIEFLRMQNRELKLVIAEDDTKK